MFALTSFVMVLGCIESGSGDRASDFEWVDPSPEPNEYQCDLIGPCGQTVPPNFVTNLDVVGGDVVSYAWVEVADLADPSGWEWQSAGGRRLLNPPSPPIAGVWVFVAESSVPGGDPIPCEPARHRSMARTLGGCCDAPPDFPGYDPTRMTWFIVDDDAEPTDWHSAYDPGPFDDETCPP